LNPGEMDIPIPPMCDPIPPSEPMAMLPMDIPIDIGTAPPPMDPYGRAKGWE
jgi:hypothetical protein